MTTGSRHQQLETDRLLLDLSSKDIFVLKIFHRLKNNKILKMNIKYDAKEERKKVLILRLGLSNGSHL